jgi:hypothetical protein
MTMTNLNQIANEIQAHLPFNIQYVLTILPNPPTHRQPIMTNRAPTSNHDLVLSPNMHHC